MFSSIPNLYQLDGSNFPPLRVMTAKCALGVKITHSWETLWWSKSSQRELMGFICDDKEFGFYSTHNREPLRTFCWGMQAKNCSWKVSDWGPPEKLGEGIMGKRKTTQILSWYSKHKMIKIGGSRTREPIVILNALWPQSTFIFRSALKHHTVCFVWRPNSQRNFTF